MTQTTIREIRQRTGLTQKKFAAVLGIPLRTLQSWELGERTPPDYIVPLIENAIRHHSTNEYE